MNKKKAISRARSRVADHVLAGIAGSDRLAGSMVLRGSTLLRAWYGDLAREPGDLDFVVIPSSPTGDDDHAKGLLDDHAEGLLTWDEYYAETLRMEAAHKEGLLRDVVDAAARMSRENTSPVPPVIIDAGRAAWDDIWDYDEAPGRRVILPWDAGRAGHGTVQIDFALDERLPADPEYTRIPRPDGGAPLTVLGATPELSLAWKLAWLVKDTVCKRKDLFDAVLLAEHVHLPAGLLTWTVEPGPGTEAWLLSRLSEARWDRDGLHKGDRALTYDPLQLVDRLMRALRSTFDAQ
ncbi:nucleotidyl transferase AbiEii/AbiGii toxin family protein [Spirillospora sp. NPDC052269]